MKWSSAIVVLPTEETLNRLRAILSSAPFKLEFERLNVVLASSLRSNVSWTPQPEIEYEATFLSVEILYDEHLGYTQLVGTLDSPMMSARMNELQPSMDEVNPRLVFNEEGTEHSRTSKSFIASIADTLVAREHQPFVFHHEVLLHRR